MRRKIIPYNPRLKALARQLRQHMTIAEAMLWTHLRNKQVPGYDFDRQRPVDEYLIDFFCKDLLLAIEVAGDSHNHRDACLADWQRQQRLESLGIRFLRFEDRMVRKDPAAVVRTIEDRIIASRAASGE